MNTVASVQFCVGQTSDGRFVAATNTAPYFCFRADSEEEAVQKAERALEFYFCWEDSHEIQRNKIIHKPATLNTWTKYSPRQVIRPTQAICA
ncbi:hypothetical protein [Parasphingorhabdus sp.]|uniref:hypothetical protein n=1 Tax=Parasphingorhabdus sp. TaxID=2709688 RepID=UPI002F942476